jgi:hypothetical protein
LIAFGRWTDRGGGKREPERGVVEKVLPSDGVHQEQYRVRTLRDGLLAGSFSYADLEQEH